MRPVAEAARPRVFISFAGSDRDKAEQMREELDKVGIETFVDQHSIAPGQDLVFAIDEALTQSDYYVLLWSRAAANRPWVKAELSAAFTRDLRENRTFLFVVRLDDTPVPLLLAPRLHLDARTDWNGAVSALVSMWHRDVSVHKQGLHVLPAPYATNSQDSEADADAGERPTIVLYVRNRDLSVEHVLRVPEDATGKELTACVRSGLGLKDSVTYFDGAVGLRFFYRLVYAGASIRAVSTLTDLGIGHGATVMLVVDVEPFARDGRPPAGTYRSGSSTGLPQATIRLLIKTAFDHLIPW